MSDATTFRCLAGLALIAAAQIMACRAAFAQTAAASATLDLTGIAIAATGGFFSVLGLVLVALINSRIKDRQAAETLSLAVKNSLGAIQQAAQAGIEGERSRLQVPIPGVAASMAPGVQYVLNQAGPEAERLGVTPEKIADKIDAQIGLANIATNLATAASPAPTPKPLDPVAAPTT